MKKILLFLTFILTLTSVNLFSQDQATGQIITEQRELDVFQSIDLKCKGKVTIVQGENQIVMIKTESKVISKLKTTVDKGILTIAMTGFATYNLLEIEITMQSIENLSVEGSGKIEVKNEINFPNLNFSVNGNGGISARVNCESIKTKISGSGNILLAGKTKSNDVEIVGSGLLNAIDMGAEIVKAKLSFAGVLQTSVNNQLTVDINGAGEVKYNGLAKLKIKISGSGTVESF